MIEDGDSSVDLTLVDFMIRVLGVAILGLVMKIYELKMTKIKRIMIKSLIKIKLMQEYIADSF